MIPIQIPSLSFLLHPFFLSLLLSLSLPIIPTEEKLQVPFLHFQDSFYSQLLEQHITSVSWKKYISPLFFSLSLFPLSFFFSSLSLSSPYFKMCSHSRRTFNGLSFLWFSFLMTHLKRKICEPTTVTLDLREKESKNERET